MGEWALSQDQNNILNSSLGSINEENIKLASENNKVVQRIKDSSEAIKRLTIRAEWLDKLLNIGKSHGNIVALVIWMRVSHLKHQRPHF